MNLSTGPSVLPPRPTQVSGRPNTQAESLPANSRKRKKKLKPCALGSATPVYRVNRHKIRTDESISPQKQDYRVLGSYNLKLNRAIIVPGSPATYQPRRAVTPFSIRPDRGLTIVDPNRHVFSNCPLEPVIRAIAITSPNHDFKSIDFIVDRHNLRFLLQFCSKKEADRDYRVDAECVGPNNTILLYSHTGPTAEEANGRTFGRNFEDTVTHKSKHYFGYGPTQPRNAKAEGEVLAHYRACSYNLGGINICMRFEVDARCDGPKQVVPSQKRDVRTSSYEPESVVAGNCTIHKAGFLVPPEEIMELKSRKLLGKRQQLRSSSYGYYDQLWFSDTPWLVVGSHQAGHFSHVRVTDSKEDLEEWEEENKENIRRLIELLRTIQAFFKESTTSKVSILWRKNTEELVFYDIEGSIVDVGLPEDMKVLWQ